jgi:hypothetical protein
MELLRRRDRGAGCAVLILMLAGCRGETPSAPSTLVDGTPARPSPVVLEGVDDPSVATLVRVTPVDSDAAGSTASCIAAIGVPAGGTIVERIGVSGRSVTYLDSGRRTAHACDASTGSPRRTTWCAHAFGRLESGRLRDPRLSLSCRSDSGRPVGFAWIQPDAATAYVVVRHSGYAEVYSTTGDAPVRVTTADADLTSSRATLAISEHAKDGRRLHSRDLEAHVAG